MAFKNKQISNPKTGQDIKFLQTAKDTNGKLLEMEATYNSHCDRGGDVLSRHICARWKFNSQNAV